MVGAGGHQSGRVKGSGGGGSGGGRGRERIVTEGTKMKNPRMEHKKIVQVANLTS